MSVVLSLFFFNDTATTEIYTLSLHDALPILHLRLDGFQVLGGEGALDVEVVVEAVGDRRADRELRAWEEVGDRLDRKSTRLNSSHANISYAVFCLKKKNKYLACNKLLCMEST